jgi:hypothetical protein
MLTSATCSLAARETPCKILCLIEEEGLPTKFLQTGKQSRPDGPYIRQAAQQMPVIFEKQKLHATSTYFISSSKIVLRSCFERYRLLAESAEQTSQIKEFLPGGFSMPTEANTASRTITGIPSEN